jgi:hypothetical protein
VEIIGAGFGRTGTMSLKVALEELGYGPCYHMVEVFENPTHIELWNAAAQGESVDWKKLFSGYQATVDWPAAAFYKELMEVYPEAKVLLTVRDPDKWYESTKNTIYSGPRQASSQITPAGGHPRQMIENLVWEGTFGGNFEDREYAIEVFNLHNKEAKEYVPSDRLLVYEVKEAWGPLCEFLMVEAPKDKPFPHLNDTESFLRMMRERLQTMNRQPNARQRIEPIGSRPAEPRFMEKPSEEGRGI